MPTPLMLNKDPEMITTMELDLVAKAQAAFDGATIQSNIHGVFSLDDLERKLESDLCGNIALGVGYAGAYRLGPTANQNPAQGNGVAPIEFRFMIILAVPADDACTQRVSATTLLSLLRIGIEGTPCKADDRFARSWTFVSEEPRISDSTKSMLYYAQVWRVAMQNGGKVQ